MFTICPSLLMGNSEKRPDLSSPVQYLMGIKARKCTTEAFFYSTWQHVSIYIEIWYVRRDVIYSTFDSRKFVLHIPCVGGQPLFFCFCTKFKKRSIL